MSRRKVKSNMTCVIAIALLVMSPAVFAVTAVSGEEYTALKGEQSIKAVFDIRISSPKKAATHLKLIHQTFQDSNIVAVTKNPDVAVIILGPAVKLVSTNREGFTPEDQQFLDEIAATVSAMSQDGIQLELCLIAAQGFGVDPASVLPEITHVGNGWISLIGYQAKGYSVIPSY